MEKLVKLLNQYEREKEGLPEDFEDYVIWEVEGDNIIQGSADPDARGYFNYYIISKDYEFIKWLVDNDKIRREGMKGHGRLISYCLYIKSWEWDKIKEGVLLMLLAISDKPIYDLISYLK